MSKDLLLPLSENFHSIQGEGFYTGVQMHFIRLAGCSVGKPPTGEAINHTPHTRFSRPAWTCQTWDGRRFFCDTDFYVHDHKTVEDLIRNTYETHLCLTGGEPLNRLDVVEALALQCDVRGWMLHIETSGTILLKDKPSQIWLTVSPKLGCLPEMLEMADEIKLLIDRDTKWQDLPIIPRQKLTFLQPVNQINEVDFSALEKCYDLLALNPSWRLSVQLHKLLRLR